MGCSQQGSYGNYGDACVQDTVRKILDAQRKATDEDSHTCATSCDRSIDDLLSPDRRHRPLRYTTIPFMLTCKDGCSTFVGTGYTSRRGYDGDRRGHFHKVESCVFKVKGFKRGSDSCVTLELLEPVTGRRDGDGHGGEERHHGSYIENFRYTGVCITVDLNCFCGISCLDPINPDSMYD